jgi:3-hydroxymyristoyl/3-hydroxydecanoyl-(acyl carrier protein) dehydratase
MAMQPEVLGQRREGDDLVLRLRVPAELEFFPGHFPGRPILPGVLQVHWAIAQARAVAWALGEFQTLEQLKFNALIEPGAELELRLCWGDGVLRFSYTQGTTRCSAGRVRFGEAR